MRLATCTTQRAAASHNLISLRERSSYARVCFASGYQSSRRVRLRNRRTGALTHRAAVFLLTMRARVAVRAEAFHLAMRARVTVRAAVFPLAMRAAAAAHALAFQLAKRARVAVYAVVLPPHTLPSPPSSPPSAVRRDVSARRTRSAVSWLFSKVRAHPQPPPGIYLGPWGGAKTKKNKKLNPDSRFVVSSQNPNFFVISSLQNICNFRFFSTYYAYLLGRYLFIKIFRTNIK